MQAPFHMRICVPRRGHVTAQRPEAQGTIQEDPQLCKRRADLLSTAEFFINETRNVTTPWADFIEKEKQMSLNIWEDAKCK